jgi:hypothetical protein
LAKIVSPSPDLILSVSHARFSIIKAFQLFNSTFLFTVAVHPSLNGEKLTFRKKRKKRCQIQRLKRYSQVTIASRSPKKNTQKRHKNEKQINGFHSFTCNSWFIISFHFRFVCASNAHLHKFISIITFVFESISLFGMRRVNRTKQLWRAQWEICVGVYIIICDKISMVLLPTNGINRYSSCQIFQCKIYTIIRLFNINSSLCDTFWDVHRLYRYTIIQIYIRKS